MKLKKINFLAKIDAETVDDPLDVLSGAGETDKNWSGGSNNNFSCVNICLYYHVKLVWENIIKVGQCIVNNFSYESRK